MLCSILARKFVYCVFMTCSTFFCLYDALMDPWNVQGGSNMTGTDLCVNKPHCAAAVRP